MSNDYRLEEFVSNEGFKQITRLKKELGEAQKLLVDSAGAAAKFNESLSKASSAKEFSANADKAAIAVQRLARETANAQLAQSKLDLFQESITQKALARIAKEEAAIAKKTKKIVSNSQIEVDAYNKSATGAGKTGTAVNDLDKAQAAAANSATQYSKANQQSAQAAANAASEIDKEYVELSDLDKLLNKTTGTLKQNVDQQVKYEIELRQISQEQKKLRDAFDSGTLSEQKYIAATSNLTVREGELKAGLLQTNLAIRQQQKENVAAGSTTEGLQARLDRLRTAYRGLTDEEKKNSAVGGVFLKNIKDIDAQIKKTEGSMGNFTKQVGDYGTKAITALSSAFIAFFAVNKFKDLVVDVFKVTAEFEKLESVLTNTLGSKSLAKKALDDIQNFAKTTPFGVQEVAGAFVKLANQGFVPTVNQLKKMGDLAASTGKTFDQLAEAILDARQGQFIRLREFGIRGEKDGDKVRLTFKGVTTEIKNSAAAIDSYIVGLGDLKGVSGAAAAVSQTLGGQISNLGDAFDQFLLKIGEGRLKPIFAGVVNGLTSILNVSIDLVKTYDQRLNDIQNERISKDVEARKVANDKEIQDRVDKGEKLIAVQLDVYKREEALQKEFRDKDTQLLQFKNAELIGLEKDLANERKNNGATDTARQLSQQVSDAKLYIRQYEYDLKKRTFLADDYAQKINTIEKNAATANADELKKIRDSEYLLAKQRLEIARDTSGVIVKDEKEDFNTRITAAGVFYDKQIKLAKLTSNHDLKQEGIDANDKIRIREKLKNDLIKIDLDKNKELNDIAVKAGREAEAEFDRIASKEQRDRLTANKTALLAIEEARDNELSNIVGNSQAAADKRFQIERKYALQSISLEIDQTQAILDQQKIRAQGDVGSLNKIQELETQLAALRRKYREEEDKEDVKGNKRKLKNFKEFLKEYGAALQEVLNGIGQLADALFEKQLQGIEQQKNDQQEYYDAQKTNIENSTASEEEKRSKIALLDAKDAARKKELADKEQRIKLQQARVDRLIQIANIIASTAQAVIYQYGVGDPYTAPERAALAGIIGAIQLATVLASPLPAYEKGGVHPKDGMALYGEKGEELYIMPDGQMGLTPSTPTVGFVPGGTEFLSHDRLKNMIAKGTLSNFVSDNSTKIDFNLGKLMMNDNKNFQDLKKQFGKRTLNTTITEKGLRHVYSDQNSKTTYLNRNLRRR